MFKELQKIWLDTTTNTVTGKYSMKRLIGWGSFHIAILFAFIYPERFELILTFLSAAFGAAGLTMAGQFLNRKTTDDNGQPLTPPCPTEPLNNNPNGIQS